MKPPLKSPLLALLISIPFPGFGHFYCGCFSRGAVIIIALYVTVLMLCAANPVVGLLLMTGLIAATARDAWRCAQIEAKKESLDLERGTPPRRWVLWAWIACRALWIVTIPGLWGTGMLLIAAPALRQARWTGLYTAVPALVALYLTWLAAHYTWDVYRGAQALPERALFTEIGTTSIVFGVCFLLFLIAAPAFAPLLRKSAEGTMKGNLAVLRGAVERYRSEHDGRAPESLEALVAARNLEKVPLLWPKFSGIDHPREALTAVVSSTAAADSGRWAYRLTGSIFIDCTHTDTRGAFWSSY